MTGQCKVLTEFARCFADLRGLALLSFERRIFPVRHNLKQVVGDDSFFYYFQLIKSDQLLNKSNYMS